MPGEPSTHRAIAQYSGDEIMDKKTSSHKIRINGKLAPGKADLSTIPTKLLISLWRFASETDQEPLCERIEEERERRLLQ